MKAGLFGQERERTVAGQDHVGMELIPAGNDSDDSSFLPDDVIRAGLRRPE